MYGLNMTFQTEQREIPPAGYPRHRLIHHKTRTLSKVSIYQSGCDAIYPFLLYARKHEELWSYIKNVDQTGKLLAALYPSL